MNSGKLVALVLSGQDIALRLPDISEGGWDVGVLGGGHLYVDPEVEVEDATLVAVVAVVVQSIMGSSLKWRMVNVISRTLFNPLTTP